MKQQSLFKVYITDFDYETDSFISTLITVSKKSFREYIEFLQRFGDISVQISYDKTVYYFNGRFVGKEIRNVNSKS